MACPRCSADSTDDRWCTECDRAYDTWSRQHATDIIWALMAGVIVLATGAVLLPILGVEPVVAAVGVFAGFGTVVGLQRVNRRRRRRQFLRGAAMPRAYLPDGGS